MLETQEAPILSSIEVGKVVCVEPVGEVLGVLTDDVVEVGRPNGLAIGRLFLISIALVEGGRPELE